MFVISNKKFKYLIAELCEDDELFCFKIEFHGTNNRSYVLGAESQESMEQWMKALACAGFDYMKLMVAELQRQLADIEGWFFQRETNNDLYYHCKQMRHIDKINNCVIFK